MKPTKIPFDCMDEVEFDPSEEFKNLTVYKNVQPYENLTGLLISEVSDLTFINNKLFLSINLYNVYANSRVAIDILVYSKVDGCLQHRGFKSITVKIPPLDKYCCFAAIEVEEVEFILPKCCCKRTIETKIIANYCFPM